MVLGRLTHYGIDLVLLSTVLAGVKRNSGFGLSPPALNVPEGAARGVADTYLGIGERTFDYICAVSYTSKYFVRGGDSPTPRR